PSAATPRPAAPVAPPAEAPVEAPPAALEPAPRTGAGTTSPAPAEADRTSTAAKPDEPVRPADHSHPQPKERDAVVDERPDGAERYAPSMGVLVALSVAWLLPDILVGLAPELRGLLPEPFDLFSHARNLKGGVAVGFTALIARIGLQKLGSGTPYLTREEMRSYHRRWVPAILVAATAINAVVETRWGWAVLGHRLFPGTVPDVLDLLYGVGFAGAVAWLSWRPVRLPPDTHRSGPSGGAALMSGRPASERDAAVIAHVVARSTVGRRLPVGDPALAELTGGLGPDDLTGCAGICVVDGLNAAVAAAGGPGDLTAWSGADGWVHMDARVFAALRAGVLDDRARRALFVHELTHLRHPHLSERQVGKRARLPDLTPLVTVVGALPVADAVFTEVADAAARAARHAPEVGAAPHPLQARVVRIEVLGPASDGKRTGEAGSGVLFRVDGRTGYVLTNRHVAAARGYQVDSKIIVDVPTPSGVVVEVAGWAVATPTFAEVVRLLAAEGAPDELVRVAAEVGRGDVDLAVLRIVHERLVDIPLAPLPLVEARGREPVTALGFPNTTIPARTAEGGVAAVPTRSELLLVTGGVAAAEAPGGPPRTTLDIGGALWIDQGNSGGPVGAAGPAADAVLHGLVRAVTVPGGLSRLRGAERRVHAVPASLVETAVRAIGIVGDAPEAPALSGVEHRRLAAVMATVLPTLPRPAARAAVFAEVLGVLVDDVLTAADREPTMLLSRAGAPGQRNVVLLPAGRPRRGGPARRAGRPGPDPGRDAGAGPGTDRGDRHRPGLGRLPAARAGAGRASVADRSGAAAPRRRVVPAAAGARRSRRRGPPAGAVRRRDPPRRGRLPVRRARRHPRRSAGRGLHPGRDHAGRCGAGAARGRGRAAVDGRPGPGPRPPAARPAAAGAAAGGRRRRARPRRRHRPGTGPGPPGPDARLQPAGRDARRDRRAHRPAGAAGRRRFLGAGARPRAPLPPGPGRTARARRARAADHAADRGQERSRPCRRPARGAARSGSHDRGTRRRPSRTRTTPSRSVRSCRGCS
ncbi:trypsin-like peptidase domain-containing protein, partial [Pseudonocardia lacus]|uniref:trypsin-like peptidase domain-containing protein n=1 Tax=Pseudonocardia lacus TaxID=2835865 RepID=UPI001BDBD1DF